MRASTKEGASTVSSRARAAAQLEGAAAASSGWCTGGKSRSGSASLPCGPVARIWPPSGPTGRRSACADQLGPEALWTRGDAGHYTRRGEVGTPREETRRQSQPLVHSAGPRVVILQAVGNHSTAYATAGFGLDHCNWATSPRCRSAPPQPRALRFRLGLLPDGPNRSPVTRSCNYLKHLDDTKILATPEGSDPLL